MRVLCLALFAGGALGARVSTEKSDLQRDADLPGVYPGRRLLYSDWHPDSLADVELPTRLTSRQRMRDRTSLRFVRHMLAMSGASIDEVFCSYSEDDCATVDEYPGRNTHSELRYDQVVEELGRVPEREVRGEIRRLGDLGYLIFNELLWANDWKTFPIGGDLEDHRKARPVGDALMGHESGAWTRDMIRQSAEEFFQGRESLNPRDMTQWNTKLLHKILLNLDITDEEEATFNDYKGSSTTVSTLPRWLVSGLRWVFSLNAARETRETLLDKYMEAMDNDTRDLYPKIEDQREKRFTADLILTALTSAGGLSTPTVMGIAFGILHGAETYGSGPLLPDGFTLTSQNVEQFVYECVRRFPVVVGFPWWDPVDLSFRTVLNVAMALRDPRAWEAPKEFRIRPISEYHEVRGAGSKIGLAWAQQGIGQNGLTPDSRGCPGQELSMVVISEFLRAYMANQQEWSVGEMPEDGMQITEGPSSANAYTLTRNGHAAEHMAEHDAVTPAPESAEEADAEREASAWR